MKNYTDSRPPFVKGAGKHIPNPPKKREIPIFEDNITYEEWCEALNLDPNDDENSISWSEMRNNQ